jgi:hypothetical protein
VSDLDNVTETFAHAGTYNLLASPVFDSDRDFAIPGTDVEPVSALVLVPSIVDHDDSFYTSGPEDVIFSASSFVGCAPDLLDDTDSFFDTTIANDLTDTTIIYHEPSLQFETIDCNAYTFRSVLPILSDAVTQVRCTFVSSNIHGLSTDHCSIGIWDGVAAQSDCTAAPVELTFGGGGHGFTISGAYESVTSDWVNLSGFTSSDKLVVIIDVSSTSSYSMFSNFASSGIFSATASADSYNVQSPGYSAGDGNVGVMLIEVR